MSGSTRFRVLLVGFWLLPAAVATLGLRLVPSRLNPDLTLVEILSAQLMIWLPWGLWSALIVAVGERVPLERGTVARAIAIHVPLSAFVICAQILVIWHVAVLFGMNQPAGLESMIVVGIRQFGDLLMVIYWAVVGTHAGIRWHERWQAESLRAARLREDLAQANLQALRAQLNPHFLFNALNAVVSLTVSDPQAARATLVRLAELLRATLAAGDAQETTLAQEIALTARYLEIEQVRFADRLTVTWTLQEELGERRVPAFALQPLVENALRHGLGRRNGVGTVEIITRASNDGLELIVRDGGPGPVSATPVRGGAGIALGNLRARLQRLYGDAASLTLETRPEGGTDAIVRIGFSAGA
jgi:anti-sigma regulatory factor (Ser/Thr protein kinase)